MNSGKFIFAILSFIFLSAFVLVAGCAQQQPAGANESAPLRFKDSALVDYILIVEIPDSAANGSRKAVYDTSIGAIARENGIYNEKRAYGPLAVEMQNDNGLLPGFTRALVGMKEGENKTFTLNPEEGYGIYDSSKVFSISRFYNMSRYEDIPLAYFEMRNLSSAIGTNLSGKLGVAQVVNSTNETVTLKYFPAENTTFVFNGLPQRVVFFDNDSILIEITVQQGTKYITESPSGDKFSVIATAMNETGIMFDANNPLAGKELTFTVFVRKIGKAQE